MKKPTKNVANRDEQLNQAIDGYQKGNVKRRDFLRRVVGLGISSSVAYATLGRAKADAQQIRIQSHGAAGSTGGHSQQFTTYAVGEEGTTPQQTYPPIDNGHSQITTQAIGEEGQPQITSHAIGEEGQTVTTRMIGEEGTTGHPPVTSHYSGEEGHTVTTHAVGEEGTTINPPPSYTTYRLGEESTTPPPVTTAYGEGNPTPTTLAVGEEGGGVQICPHTGLPIQSTPQHQPRWNGWRRW